MSGFYDNLQATASKLLSQKGQLVTLIRAEGDVSYDPATATAAPAGTTTYSGAAAVFPFPSQEVDGKDVLRTDRKVYLQASGIPDPAPGDVLTINGVPHRVVRPISVAPAGTSVVHILQVRAGG